ncbi:MAG TPA: FtsX-like permease family protein [Capillimicrobium sp.]|nr:FtsX-like permease family protein [Capillimicrobium sp.]
MLALSLKGFGARKLRVSLTVIAVALGVALISGTYVLTDTINRSFDDIFATAYEGTDVSISPQDAVEADDGGEPATTLPASLLRRVERQPHVEKASGSIFTSGAAFTDGGDRMGGQGPPTFIASVQPEPFEVFDAVEGELPGAPGETAILKGTADQYDLDIGDTIEAVGDGPRQPLRIVGLLSIGGSDVFGGSVIVLTTLEEAQRLTGNEGRFDEIAVQATGGTTPLQLRDELRPVVREAVGDTARVRTGEENANRQSQDIQDNLSFVRTFLLVFAAIAVFVGAFIIFNTFSITVAQRMREFALLRTLGASKRQVMGSVLFEGLLMGVLGALAGLALGLLLARGLKALFAAFGADLPAEGMVVAPRTIVVSLLVGIVVTLVSGIAPALRATRVPPVAALREGAVLPAGRGRRFVTPGGVALAVLGAGLLGAGLFGGAGILLVGIGALVVFLGIALLSPKLVPPLARTVGRPLEALRGITGRLARENAMRQPGRTAVTASALMIGVTLVAFVSILAAGFSKTIDDAVDTAARPGTLIVMNTDGFSPMPSQIATGLRRLDPDVSAIRFSTSRVEGVSGKSSVSSVDPETLPRVFDNGWEQGSARTWSTLDGDGVVLTQGYAEDHDLAVGQRLRVTTPTGKHLELTVRGIADDDSGLLADLTVSNALAAADFGETQDSIVFLGTDPADEQRVQDSVSALLERAYPVAEVLTLDEFKDQQAGQINQLLVLIYVLLSLAVIVSLFGIVNTLVLSIYERTRELGMLRAIGTSRRQVRTMIRYEAVITSLIGAVIGIALGVLFGIAVAQALADDGFKFALPVGTLIVLLVLGMVAGVLAAIGPARRASKLDVLEALAYE